MSVDLDDCDGWCPVWEEEVRRARKEHRCDACGEIIRRGDRYGSTRSLYDGSWQTTCRCARCETMFSFLQSVMPSGEACHRSLDCGHEWSEIHRDVEPPEWVQALPFLTKEEAQEVLAPGSVFAPTWNGRLPREQLYAWRVENILRKKAA